MEEQRIATTTPWWVKSAQQAHPDQPPALRIRVVPSHLTVCCSALLHTLAACAVLISGVPATAAIPMLAAILLSTGIAIRNARQACILIWHADNRIEILLADDSGRSTASASVNSGWLTVESFHSHWIIVLGFKRDGGSSHRLVIASDAVSVGSFRRIRTRLQMTSPEQLHR